MKATSTDSTLCLNQSNHPSVPPEGLELPAGVPTTVPAELGDYLRSLDCTVVDDPPAPKRPAAPKIQE